MRRLRAVETTTIKPFVAAAEDYIDWTAAATKRVPLSPGNASSLGVGHNFLPVSISIHRPHTAVHQWWRPSRVDGLEKTLEDGELLRGVRPTESVV